MKERLTNASQARDGKITTFTKKNNQRLNAMGGWQSGKEYAGKEYVGFFARSFDQ